MVDIICLSVGADHSFICARKSKTIARSGESDVTRFEITLVEQLCNCWPYLEFEKANGEKFKTPRLEIVNNKIIYDVPLSVLDVGGELKVQVVLQKGDGKIWKSDNKNFFVRVSIDATEDILEKEDFVADVQGFMDDTKEFIAEANEFVAEASHFAESTEKQLASVSDAIGGSANALKGSAEGNPVVITDVSPLEHEMNVAIGVSGATLQTFGKNLWDMRALDELFVPDPDEEGAYISTRNISTTDKIEVNLPAGVYTISGYVKSPLNPSDNKNENYGIAFYYADGTRDTYTKQGNGEYKFQSATSNGKPIAKIGFWYRKNGGIVGLKDLQLEVGSAYTEYEPFVQSATYTADESGNVKATSIYPTTLLVADDGVSIMAEYNKDTNKAIENVGENVEPMVESLVAEKMRPRSVGQNTDLSKEKCEYIGEIILKSNGFGIGWYDAYICLSISSGLGTDGTYSVYNWTKLN